MSSAASRNPVADASIAPRVALAVEWSIARQAVRVAMPDLDLPPNRGRRTDVTLVIEVSGRSCSAELRDAQTGQSHPLEITGVSIDSIVAGEFTHVTVREGTGDLLSATVRTGDGEPRLVYARTSLLERLGIRGGRYARPSLSA